MVQSRDPQPASEDAAKAIAAGAARIAVIIASRGRPAELGHWRQHIARQTLAPVVMIWSVHSPEDLPGNIWPHDALPVTIAQGRTRLRICRSALGAARQRNAGMALVPDDCDIVAFFDDDYVPASRCLEGIARAFAQWPDVAGVTGRLIADGVHSRGVGLEAALALVAAADALPLPAAIALRPRIGLYGCNMAFRADALAGERFDEQLPLYSWQEDVDFAMRVARRGRIGATDAFVGVHRGVKGGRTSGRRFGYSQVANILYLGAKGTMPWGFGLALMARNIVANHVRLLWPEPWVDRRGRVAGNWLALRDLLRGRLHPLRAGQI